MQKVIEYLVENMDVLNKVNEGLASLIGVSRDEQNSILEIFYDEKINPTAYFWM